MVPNVCGSFCSIGFELLDHQDFGVALVFERFPKRMVFEFGAKYTPSRDELFMVKELIAKEQNAITPKGVS